MTPLERRALIETAPNPDPRLDYVAELDTDGTAARTVTVSLRYVPDRLILAAASFGRYLDAVCGGGWDSVEALAVAVRDDVNDRLVPRWLLVAVAAPGHRVLIEDRQPRWDNPHLLARLRRF